MISAGRREANGASRGGLRGSASQNYLSREASVGNSGQYPQVRYNGNAFGGFNMTDSLYPRKSNLNDRKKDVLKVAAENF